MYPPIPGAIISLFSSSLRSFSGHTCAWELHCPLFFSVVNNRLCNTQRRFGRSTLLGGWKRAEWVHIEDTHWGGRGRRAAPCCGWRMCFADLASCYLPQAPSGALSAYAHPHTGSNLFFISTCSHFRKPIFLCAPLRSREVRADGRAAAFRPVERHPNESLSAIARWARWKYLCRALHSFYTRDGIL